MVGNICVKRSVYDAAQEALRETEGNKPLSLVGKKMDDCQAAGDKTGYRFWGEVYNFLMESEYLNGPVEIIES